MTCTVLSRFFSPTFIFWIQQSSLGKWAIGLRDAVETRTWASSGRKAGNCCGMGVIVVNMTDARFLTSEIRKTGGRVTSSYRLYLFAPVPLYEWECLLCLRCAFLLCCLTLLWRQGIQNDDMNHSAVGGPRRVSTSIQGTYDRTKDAGLLNTK
jgi:hypothetical protein